MRRCALLLCVAVLGVPAGAEPLMSDDPGDQEVHLAGVASPAESHQEIDLVGATFVEHPDTFEVRLAFGRLERGTASTGGAIGGDFARLAFTYDGKEYAADFYPYRDLDDQVRGFAYLSEYDRGRDAHAIVEAMTFEVDPQASELIGTFAREAIHGADGTPVTKDKAFEGFWAESLRDLSIFASGVPAPSAERAYDRMPNEGVAPARHVVEHGLPQTGTARLSSDEAFRISNGEATTFLYRLEAVNLADHRATFLLEAEDVPDTWTVTFPDERLRIDAQGSVEVPVLVTMPFNHQHGATDSMRVLLTSQADPESVGRLEIGVRYTRVPQPAGHHDTMYVHSGEQVQFLPGDLPLLTSQEPSYFNTVEDYEFDTGIAARPDRVSCTGSGMSHVFALDLVPGIAMGLDFDLARQGVFEGRIRAQTPSSGLGVHGELLYLPGGDLQADPVVLASLEGAGPEPMEAGQTRAVSLAITPTKEADYVRHVPGSVLRLQLVIDDQPLAPSTICYGGTGLEPLLEPGAWFDLPLREYHDDVADYFQAASGMDLYAEVQHKLVNPGDSVLFNITAENTGTDTGVYDLELAGSNTGWAMLMGPDELRLDPGGTRVLRVAVHVPADAADGMLADLTLHASARDQSQIRSVLRLVAEVDTEAEHADESRLIEALEADRQSPGSGVAVPLLAAAAFLRRLSGHRRT